MLLSPEISKVAINKMHAKLNARQELSNYFSVRILNWDIKGPDWAFQNTNLWPIVQAMIVKLNLLYSRGKQNGSKLKQLSG